MFVCLFVCTCQVAHPRRYLWSHLDDPMRFVLLLFLWCALLLWSFGGSASENTLSYLMSYFLLLGILLHSWNRCLWVSSAFAQDLHMVSLYWFL